jgi:lipopolysaccharide/colanic/teichoic acid biosynthesis glycosyltransferase
VLFVQERLGCWRRPFSCLKFRTMCQDAERLTGPVWAAANDPRITRVGWFLRKSRMDELPQLINVLRGEMSLVGTRPIRGYFAEQLADIIPFYDLRFLEKPGLTGWAQVKYRYSSSFTEQIEKFYFDYYYVRNRSLALDLYIMFLTVAVVVRMKGE